MYAKVYIDASSAASDRIYEYIIPDSLSEIIKPAMRVGVPFGVSNKHCQAFVVSVCEESEYAPEKLKSIAYIADTQPAVPDYLVETAVFLRNRYFCSYAEAIRCVLPSGEKLKKNTSYTLTEDMPFDEFSLGLSKENSDSVRALYDIFSQRKEVSLQYIKSKINIDSDELLRLLSLLIKNEKINIHEEFVFENHEQFDEYVSLISEENSLSDYLMIIGKRAVKQRQIVEYLFEKKLPVLKSTLYKETNSTSSSLTGLLENNLVKIIKKQRQYLNDDPLPETEYIKPQMSEEQQAAYDIYKSKPQGCKFLLYGVTGSGKTNLFFEMFDDMLSKGKQCLLLVPEISLTPQMMRLVKARFKKDVAIMHSKLTPAERYSEYLKIKRKEAKIVLGARSALFMPFKDLGIIVIDEMHETSYKSSNAPRYDAIETAEFISNLTNATLVLASATPTTQTYYEALGGKYELLKLTQRVNGTSLPKVDVVDMRVELREGNHSPISNLLHEKIQDRLDKNEQVLLFLNRRGYNTYVFCRECGYIEMCPNCAVSLTTHASSHTMRCHYCGYTKPIPRICPSCHSEKIKFMGTGTEKIQSAVTQMFPNAKVMRMDADTANGKNVQNILESFAKGCGDILIGTQMIVKGLDFDKLSLVGILLADSSLNFPDINAASRTFQLTTQAAGRAGRRKSQGEVVMQTYKPQAPTLVYASQHDFEGFYAYDIAFRRDMNYPPFSEIIGFFCANISEDKCTSDTQKLYERIKTLADKYKENENITIYEPAPAFIQKLKNKHIRHVLIKHEPNGKFSDILRANYDKIRSGLNSYVYVEISPVTLL